MKGGGPPSNLRPRGGGEGRGGGLLRDEKGKKIISDKGRESQNLYTGRRGGGFKSSREKIPWKKDPHV